MSIKGVNVSDHSDFKGVTREPAQAAGKAVHTPTPWAFSDPRGLPRMHKSRMYWQSQSIETTGARDRARRFAPLTTIPTLIQRKSIPPRVMPTPNLSCAPAMLTMICWRRAVKRER